MLSKTYFIIFAVYLIVLINDHHSDAVSVRPILCPSNKIAPNRRRYRTNRAVRPKTFGFISGLFSESDGPGSASNLQEQPQEDDDDDCGDIEDYDETDLSSLTSTRRPQPYDNRFFFNLYNDGNGPQYQGPNRPQNTYPRPPYGPPVANPGRPPQRPPINQGPYNPFIPSRPPNGNRPPYVTNPPYPVRPQRPPTRPPYASGGVFENNPYRPPFQQYPSDHIKPIHEEVQDPYTSTYRPIVVGGQVGSVVGVPVRPVRPQAISTGPVRPEDYPNGPNSPGANPTPRPFYQNDQDQNTKTRKPRTRIFRNDTIIGSFIDLLLK